MENLNIVSLFTFEASMTLNSTFKMVKLEVNVRIYGEFSFPVSVIRAERCFTVLRRYYNDVSVFPNYKW